MAPSRRLGCLVVLCALAAAHEPTEHERLDTDYDYVVKTRSKGPRAADEDQTLLALTDSAYATGGGLIIRASQWAAHHAEGAGVALFDEGPGVRELALAVALVVDALVVLAVSKSRFLY